MFRKVPEGEGGVEGGSGTVVSNNVQDNCYVVVSKLYPGSLQNLFTVVLTIRRLVCP